MSGHRKRQKKHEEENSERWLLTYADMITLLVAFFMMMYSMSVMNLEKFKQAAIGIRSGFNNHSIQEKPGGESILEKGTKTLVAPPLPPVVLNQPIKQEDIAAAEKAERVKLAAARAKQQQEARNQRIKALSKKFEDKLHEVSPSNKAKVVATNKGIAIEMIGDLIFFPRGTAQLSDEAKKILRAMIDILSSVPNEISVEGHTSSGKAKGTTFLDNWELSTARATSVVKYLLSTGTVDPKRISVTGYGEYRPISKEATASPANEHNDRVRVFIFQD